MWIETESTDLLNLDAVELIFVDDDKLVARLRSGGELTIKTGDLDDAVAALRRHLLAGEPQDVSRSLASSGTSTA